MIKLLSILLTCSFFSTLSYGFNSEDEEALRKLGIKAVNWPNPNEVNEPSINEHNKHYAFKCKYKKVLNALVNGRDIIFTPQRYNNYYIKHWFFWTICGNIERMKQVLLNSDYFTNHKDFYKDKSEDF